MGVPPVLDGPSALLPLAREPHRSALFFDLDGTLSPFVDDPRRAPFEPATAALVDRLARRYGLVAIVSGRAAAALRSIVGVPGVVYVGNHGLEILRDGEREVLVPPAVVARCAAIARALAPRLRGIPGLFFEEKELSLAIHYRRAPDEAAARHSVLEALRAVDLEGFRVKGGKKLLQIRPDVAIDKGTTVMMLLQRSGLRRALYAGDDLTDLDAFRRFREARTEGFDLVALGVQDRETDPAVLEACDYVVEGVEGMARVLRWLADPSPGPGA